MKLFKTITSNALLASACALASAATPLVDLVDEKAPLVISFTDVPSLVKNLGESPWAKTWNDAQVQAFFAPMRAKMDFDSVDEKIKAETGRSFKELLAFASGDALFAMTTVDFDIEAEDAENNLPFIAAIELGANASEVQKLLEEDRKKTGGSHETEDFDGVTLHIETLDSRSETGAENKGPEKAYWAMVDGVWIMGFHKDTVLSTIDAFKKGGAENAFGKSTAYLIAKGKSGASHVSVLVNFGVIIPRIQQEIAAKASEGTQSDPLFNPSAIIPALGLDAWNVMYLNVHCSDSQTAMTGGFTFSEERGLLKMFSYGEGPVARPSFVPAKWITVSTGKFSLKSFYSGLEEMLAAYNPAVLGMGQLYLQQFNQKLGIDIKRDFFGSFGADTISGYALRPGDLETQPPAFDELDQFLGFSLDNSQAFVTALDALVKAAGPNAEQMITKREYLGSTINTFSMPTPADQPQKSISYTVAKNYLMVSLGTPAALESVLQGNQESFWERRDVKQALEKIPANASSFTYQKTSTVIGSVFQSLVKVSEMQQAQATNPAQNAFPIDPSAKPDVTTLMKYWGDATGHLTRDSQGYYFKSTLDHKP
jgi:hypothetical protein